MLSLFAAAACTSPDGSDDQPGDDDNPATGCTDFGDPDARVATVAGCDEPGATDGSREEARFNNPVGIARGPDGKLYVADFDNGAIRVVTDDGATSTLVAEEGFRRPFALAFVDDTLYVATDDNPESEHSDMSGTIWEVNIVTGATRVIVQDIGRTRGLLPLPDGRLVMSDYQHHAVRVLTPSTKAITNLAGAFGAAGHADQRGTQARFAAPYGMARFPDGRIAVADADNRRIRVIETDGDVITLAGSGAIGDGDGAALTATFTYPQAVAIGDDGAVYVTDTENFVIRKIHDGQVTTIAGSGEGGWRDSDDLRSAQFYGLEGMTIDGSTLWVADGSKGEAEPYHRIRKIEL